MSLFAVILIAISLAMDCFSVSITTGVCNKNAKITSITLMAFLFGFFQMMMPYIGYFLGLSFIKYIQQFDHWIAFVILLAIGLNMIISKEEDDEKEKSKDFFTWKSLLLLSVATSIDALATGLVFISEESFSIHIAFAIIGITSILLSFLGYYLGRYIGKKITFKFEIVGGVILILIGTKILVEHLMA